MKIIYEGSVEELQQFLDADRKELNDMKNLVKARMNIINWAADDLKKSLYAKENVKW